MKKMTAILMALAMILSLASAETTAVRLIPEGVQIGMNAEAIIALEEKDPDMDGSADSMRDIEYEDASFGELKCQRAYILIDDSLKMTGMYLFEDNTPEALAVLKQKISDEYGDASEVEPETITKLFKEMSGQETPFTFSDASAWQADENTVVMAFMVSQEEQSMCYVIYVSAEYLQSIGL